MRMNLLFVAFLCCSLPAAGQASLLFRYDPAPGRQIHALTEMRTLTTMVGLPRVPDGTTLEVEARIFSHERVMEPATEGLRVRVGVDSVKVRQRAGEAAWTDVPPPDFAGHAARAVVDDRLHVVGIETTATEDGALLRVLTGWAANLGFAFPDTAVAIGGTFRTGAQMPFDVTLSDASGLAVREVLQGDLQLTLDSIVVRPADTLAFLRFVGRFAPRTVESTGEAGTRTDTFDGGFAGSLLWSTGWDAFVGASVRVRVTGRLHSETAAGVVDATVEWDATLVHRLRT